MKTTDIKEKLNFYADALFGKGYDIGWATALDELDQISDTWWNEGHDEASEMLRMEIKKLRGEDVL